MQNYLENLKRGFVKNIIAIIIILVVVFFSQRPEFREYGKGLYSQVTAQGQSWWQGAYSYAEKNVFSKIGGEVGKGEEAVKEKITEEKNNFVKNIWEKIKNYFANIFSKTTGTKVE